MYPFLLKLYNDAGYHGPKFQQGMARVRRAVNVEIVRRCDSGKFVVLPKRWIVERTSACLNRCRWLMSRCLKCGSDLISVHGDGPSRVQPAVGASNPSYS